MRWLYSVSLLDDFFFSTLLYFFPSLYHSHILTLLMFFCMMTTDCVLYAVGKPVYHKSTNVTYGSWLKDSHPRNKEMAEKIWTTYETHHNIIYEFADKTSFRNNQANDLRLKSPGFQVCSCFEMLSLLICVYCFMCVHVCLCICIRITLSGEYDMVHRLNQKYHLIYFILKYFI